VGLKGVDGKTFGARVAGTVRTTEALKMAPSRISSVTPTVQPASVNRISYRAFRGLTVKTIHQYQTIFLYSAAVILIVTAVAKLYSATGSLRILDHSDPMLMLSNRQVFMLVGLIELAVAGYCLWGRALSLKLLSTAWLATMFGLYRVGLWWTGPHGSCGCLGTVADMLPVSAQAVDHAMLGLVAYLWLGSVGLLILSRPDRSGPSGAEQPVQGRGELVVDRDG
jgi:hypothetical protein